MNKGCYTITHNQAKPNQIKQYLLLMTFFKQLDPFTAKLMEEMWGLLLYGCTTWTLTKQLKKKLDGSYARMLRAILNKSWWQHPTRHQLYGHLPPIMKTIQVRQTRHAGHCWRSRDELIWPGKSRTTSSNIHTAAMWGYRM